MNTSHLMAGASRFAHFAGLTRTRSSARADDRDDDQRNGEEDADDEEDEQPKGKQSRANDDDDQDQAPKGKRSKASDDDEDEDEQPKSRGRKSRAEDDEDDDAEEDDDKEEMSGRSAKASARLREQQRIAAILGNKASARNPALAVSLACTTRMTRMEVIKVLQDQPEREDDAGDRRQGRDARGDRQRRNVSLGSDAGNGPTGKQATKAGWDKAFSKLGIKPR